MHKGKPAWNHGPGWRVVLVMEGTEERIEEKDDGPMTQRCVYVHDRDSQRWIARAESAASELFEELR